MMKKITIFLSCLYMSFIALSQVNVRYKPCTDCVRTEMNDGVNTFRQYGEAVSYQPDHIVSDFGPRCSSGYDFHGGVDFSSQTAEGDRGDLLLAIEGGTVYRIFANARFKYIIIANNNHTYGYAHIFRSDVVNNDYLKSGNMVLKAIDDDSDVYAIIFLGYNQEDTPVALCTIAGRTVTWNNQQIITTNRVAAGDPIAPVGDSYGPTGNLESHLHLYEYPTTTPASNDDDFVSNPLQGLTYQPQGNLTATLLHAEVTAGTTFKTLASSDIIGSTFSKIRVRCTTDNTITGSENGKYNAFMNVEEVSLKIKQTNEDDEQYKLLKGASFDSKISVGGRRAATNTYPKYITDKFDRDRRTTGGSYIFDPATNADNPINPKNGIIPWMYCNDYAIGKTRPFDDYIFSDIVTGLHKNDPKEQKTPYAAPMLATWQKDARYTDGEYQLRAEVLRINNEVVTSAPLTFTIDNFKPYLESVRVSLDGKQANDPIYAAAWDFNSALNEGKGGLQNRVSQQNAVTETSYTTDRKLRIRAKYSEGMKTQYLLIKDAKGNNVLPTQIVTASETEYDYIFDYNDIDRILSQETNTYTIHASGKDYAENNLLNLHKMTGYPNNMVIPYKKADNTWSATAIDAANDESFVFDLQGTCSGNGGILPEEVVVRSPQAGCKLVRFTYKIQSSGCNVTFVSNDTYDAGYWAFGDGGIFEPAPFNGTKATVKHSYTKPGTYKVRLWYGNNPKDFYEEDIVIAGCAEDNTAAREKNIECQVIGPTLAKAGEVVTLTGVITGFGPFYDSPWEYDPTKATPTSPNPKGDGAHDFTINPFLMEGDRVLIDLKAKNDYRATKTCTHEIVISGNPPKVKLLQYNTRYPKRPLLLAITQNVPSFSLVQYQFIITRNGTAPVIYDRNGVYEFVPDGDLIDGVYTAVVKATYDNVTATSNQVIFTIGTPPAPVPSAPDFEVLPAGNIEVTMGDCTPLLQLKMNNLPIGQKIYDVTYENQTIGQAIVNEKSPPFVPYDDNYCIRAKQLGSNGKVLDKGEVLVPYSTARRDGVVVNDKFCPSYEYVGCVDVVYEVCPKAYYNGKYVLNNTVTTTPRPVPSIPYNLCEPVVAATGELYGTIPLFPLVIKEPCKINVKYKEMVINDFTITAACQPSITVLAQYGAADFSKGIVPSGAPCSGTQAYKNYTWKAFDARNPTQELVGFLQNINSECVYIQTNHVYLQQFKQGDTVEFMCQVTITDWLDITKTYSKFVTMAVPLRIDIPTTLPMCVGVDKSFEKYEIAVSGSNTLNVSLSNGGEYVQIANNGELHIQLPTDYTDGNINAVLSATDG